MRLMEIKKKRSNANYILQAPSTLYFFKWAIPDLFLFILGLFNKQYNFYDKLMWKMSIQCPVLGFEPTSSWTWVVFRNH